ncbi:EXS-domain-containing protein [Melanogaster broomeanus]|nr:EXS-domain-containing protein [Melanogaster broomeanus]
MSGSARWWTIKNIAKLGASGIRKVEFTDFWLGDQFCSLAYSFSNLFFIGCFYTRIFPNIHSTLSSSQNWGWYYTLGSLPLLIRLAQSLRRYRDSRLPIHLINAGKYAMGMINYFFYYYWRHKDNLHHGTGYVLWCFTAIIYATYACAWDFLMDWSMCKPHARHPFLRPELVYTSQIPSYYFALVSNLCIRFFWICYIPSSGPSLTLRTFIAATLEMLRRVQWNFYRIENEHLGNMDQYRVTRELPLPYNIDPIVNDDEEEEEGGEGEECDEDANAEPSWLAKQLMRDSRRISYV